MSSADFINYLAGRYARSVHPLSGGVMQLQSWMMPITALIKRRASHLPNAALRFSEGRKVPTAAALHLAMKLTALTSTHVTLPGRFAALALLCLAAPANAATLPPIYDASIYHGGKWSPMPIIEAAPVQGDLWPIIGGVVLVAALLLLFDGDGGNGKAVAPPPASTTPVPLPASIWLMLAAVGMLFLNPVRCRGPQRGLLSPVNSPRRARRRGLF